MRPEKLLSRRGGAFEDKSPYKVLINDKTKLDIAMPALKQMIVYQISVDNAPVTPQQLQPLFVNYSIKSLKLTGSTITDEVFAAFCRMPLVDQIDLHETAITDQGIKSLSRLKSLKTLSLGQNSTKVTPQGLVFLKEMPFLTRLQLSGMDLAETTLAFLSSLKNLTHLSLTSCKVADGSLAYLKDLPELKDLNLSSSRMSDAAVTHLDKLSKLVSLTLSFTPITNKALASLSSLKSLESLDLTSTAITDEGLVNLKELNGLRILSLSFTKITDEGLPHLDGLTKLISLSINSTKVTKKAREAFIKKMPNVTVYFSGE